MKVTSQVVIQFVSSKTKEWTDSHLENSEKAKERVDFLNEQTESQWRAVIRTTTVEDSVLYDPFAPTEK